MTTNEREIIAETTFNRDDDANEFGSQRRIIDIAAGENIVSFSFELGRKDGDTITLLFDWPEFLLKLGKLF